MGEKIWKSEIFVVVQMIERLCIYSEEPSIDNPKRKGAQRPKDKDVVELKNRSKLMLKNTKTVDHEANRKRGGNWC
uniref:Uncharacterized protein n=1 Tax=Cucumis melo TaxID=3656 RepID=A0A9I9DM81_CUCME